MELKNQRPVLLLCVIDIILFIISLSLDVSVYRLLIPNYQGIWCGVFYLLAGGLGLIIVYIKRDQQIVRTGLIVSCLAAILGIVAAGLSGSDAQKLSKTCDFAFVKFVCKCWYY